MTQLTQKQQELVKSFQDFMKHATTKSGYLIDKQSLQYQMLMNGNILCKGIVKGVNISATPKNPF